MPPLPGYVAVELPAPTERNYFPALLTPSVVDVVLVTQTGAW